MAAGGGGDAVGILLARRILDPNGEGPALISTCAWERLRIDPVPGPRPLSGFTGLGEVGGSAVEVLASSDTLPPGRSMLPRLAAEADARIFMHDFEGGAQGLADQLRSIATAVGADRLVVGDVGGDVVATGSEPNLLSPLADSLTLAAALETGVPTTLAVIGPGTDAELAEDEVSAQLARLGADNAGRISPEDVNRCKGLLTWHPTEASMLVAAAATGQRGAVEMRRGGRPIPLTAKGRETWLVESPALNDFPLAKALVSTKSLLEAINVIEGLTVNEIAYERAKAARGNAHRHSAPRLASDVASEAIANGATHITTRRLEEACGQCSIEAVGVRASPGESVTGVAGLWPLSTLASGN